MSAVPDGDRPAPGAVATRNIDIAAQLFEQWRGGDERSLDLLVRRFSPMLWHQARAYRADPATAQDAVQVTWLAFVRHGDSIREPQAVLRWLTVTVQREAAKAVRAAARTAPVELDQFEHRLAPEEGADEVVLRSRTDRALWAKVGDLSERCQRLLRVLAFSDRPDYRKLSVELDMPIGSIGPTRARCLEKLRHACLADPEWRLS